MKFKIGDTLFLNVSGSPEMLVVETKEDTKEYRAVWFDLNQQMDSGIFPEVCLNEGQEIEDEEE